MLFDFCVDRCFQFHFRLRKVGAFSFALVVQCKALALSMTVMPNDHSAMTFVVLLAGIFHVTCLQLLKNSELLTTDLKSLSMSCASVGTVQSFCG